MKILVTAKLVEDPESRIRVKPDGSGIVTEGVAYKLNPFDEIAVEEALRLQAAKGGEIVAVSIGTAPVQTALRHALAMGADRAVWVHVEQTLDPDAVARLLRAVVAEEAPDLVLMGKQSIDDDQAQVGPLLAARLGWGQACFASKLESLESEAEKARQPAIELGDGVVRLLREIDGGLERLEVRLPCVITTDLRLNEPRYATLQGIMKSRKKPIAERKPAELGVDLALKVRVRSLREPPRRKAGERVADVAALVAKLRDEAKVL